MLVYTYGTLKRNYGNGERILKGKSEFITTGIVRGFKLFNSGFPVAIPNADTCITGEIFDIGDVENDTQAKITLSRLDSLEGYDRASHTGMYTREPVTVYGDDGNTYPCQMYVGGPTWRNGEGMRECPNDDNKYTWSR